MLREFVRVVHECQSQWFLCENVPSVPDLRIDGYKVQRIPISDEQCGGVQVRTRHIQYGSKAGHIIRPNRSVKHRSRIGRKSFAITTKQNSRWASFAGHCRKQGIEPLDLPGWSKQAKFRAVGNGVPAAVGRALAAAVAVAGPPDSGDCPCGCGRRLAGRQRAATSSCRKRLQLDRERARDYVDIDGWHPSVEKRDSSRMV